MIILPRRRHNFADQLPIVGFPVAKPIECRFCYFTLPAEQGFVGPEQELEVTKEREIVGKGAFDVIRKILRRPSKTVGKVIESVIAGKVSTNLKNAISVLDRDPTKRRQHVGEKHAPLKIGKFMGFANYMGQLGPSHEGNIMASQCA